jgi:hypothetical protein
LSARSWEFQWGTADGHGGFVRLALHPEDRVAWYWAYLWRPGLGPVAVRDHEVARPRGKALEIRADSLWAELVCETPGEHWSIGLEAFAVALDEPDVPPAGEIGERIAFGLDLEWETTGEGGEGGAAPGRVRGDVLLGRETIPVDTPGPFIQTVDDVGFGDRTIVAWDDGSWSWSDLLDGVVETRARAEIRLGDDRFVTRALGAASLFSQRHGTAWIQRFTDLRERID